MPRISSKHQLAADETELLLSSVNYAESLFRPAEDEGSMRAAIDAIASLRIRVLAPDAATARNAARFHGLGMRSAGLALCEPLA